MFSYIGEMRRGEMKLNTKKALRKVGTTRPVTWLVRESDRSPGEKIQKSRGRWKRSGKAVIEEIYFLDPR
jgi:hypothetical protein